MLLHSWLIIALPVVSFAVKGASVWRTRAVTAFFAGRARQARELRVAKAVKGELRREFLYVRYLQNEVSVALAVRRLSV